MTPGTFPPCANQAHPWVLTG